MKLLQQSRGAAGELKERVDLGVGQCAAVHAELIEQSGVVHTESNRGEERLPGERLFDSGGRSHRLAVEIELRRPATIRADC